MPSINDSDIFEIPNNEPALSFQLIKISNFAPSLIFFRYIIRHVRAQHQNDGDPSRLETLGFGSSLNYFVRACCVFASFDTRSDKIMAFHAREHTEKLWWPFPSFLFFCLSARGFVVSCSTALLGQPPATSHQPPTKLSTTTKRGEAIANKK